MPVTAVKEEVPKMYRQWEASKDGRNKHLTDNWRYISHAVVSNGRQQVFLTSAIRPEGVMQHVKGVLGRKTAVEDMA